VGVWKDQDHIKNLWQEERRFSPQTSKAETEQLLAGWEKALARAKNWLD
jgi:glycerol kinase